MKGLEWSKKNQNQQPIIKVPLQFTFPPVEILMKQLTKLNSAHPYRIVYLGPRWDNSVIFHKKYSNGAYQFKQRKISKNTSFLHDSMIHNQFYKNEIYYRAFQGMNPTLNPQNEVIFESRFQGGNLDCVVKVSDSQYDLFLRIDSNTRGHIFWFYFSVKNVKKGKKIKLNLANLTKNDTHYTKGLNPYMYSSNTQSWNQERMNNLTFKEKRLRYQFLYQKLKIRNFYQLSFQIESLGEEEMRFAYCIPYNYSDLLKDLKEISSVAEIGSLGQTLTGINIPLVMIGKNQQEQTKPVLLITGRIHPGESNSSIMISHLMKYMCFSPQAKYLREKILTVIIPMTNPDGVILGNSRCGASGKDLNREFTTNSKAIFPEIVLIKNLVDKIMETHDIEFYLDFHGHSRKKNMFTFGPSYNLTQPEYYKCRIFPKLLSNYTSTFRYYSCTYDIPYQKKSTGRAVMFNEHMIPFVYTIQCSLGFYHDYSLHRDMVFTRKKWEQLGQSIVLALKECFQGIEQYDLYLENKKKSKNAIIQQIKSANASTMASNIQMVLTAKKSQKQPKKELKDMKIMKIFEEIKQLEEKRPKQQKKQKLSDNESDSYDEKEQLQKEKMHQFAGMVTEFVQQQIKAVNNTFEKVYTNKKNEKVQKKVKTKQQRRQQRFQRYKQEQHLLREFSQQKNTVSKRYEVKSQSKNRYRAIIQQRSNVKYERAQVVSQQGKNEKQPHRQINLKSRQRRMILHQYLDEEVDFVSVEKKTNNKNNVRMFNFSKMVQEPKSLRYQDHKEYIKAKEFSHNFIDKSVNYKKHSQNNSDFSHYSSNLQEQSEGRPTYMNLENMVNAQHHQYNRRQQSFSKNSTDDIKQIKGRIGFPSSFYRIKYHNNQRKKLQIKKQKQLYEYQQYQKIHQLNAQNNLNSYSGILPKQSKQMSSSVEYEDEDGLFLKVKKFPIF